MHRDMDKLNANYYVIIEVDWNDVESALRYLHIHSKRKLQTELPFT